MDQCQAWQSTKAATELKGAGYDVDLVTLAGADHYAPVFQELVDGELVTTHDDSAGDATVDAVVHAIDAHRDDG